MSENDLQNLPPEPGEMEDPSYGVQGLEHLLEPPENDHELGDLEMLSDAEDNDEDDYYA